MTGIGLQAMELEFEVKIQVIDRQHSYGVK